MYFPHKSKKKKKTNRHRRGSYRCWESTWRGIGVHAACNTRPPRRSRDSCTIPSSSTDSNSRFSGASCCCRSTIAQRRRTTRPERWRSDGRNSPGFGGTAAECRSLPAPSISARIPKCTHTHTYTIIHICIEREIDIVEN